MTSEYDRSNGCGLIASGRRCHEAPARDRAAAKETHVYPPELARAPLGGITPFTIENLLDAHEQVGIDGCVISNTIHCLKDKTDQESLDFIKRWNEYAAEIQQKYKDRIIVFTSTLPCGAALFVKELERGVVQYGLQGVLINSSHQHAYPDDDAAEPFFELVESLASAARQKDHRGTAGQRDRARRHFRPQRPRLDPPQLSKLRVCSSYMSRRRGT